MKKYTPFLLPVIGLILIFLLRLSELGSQGLPQPKKFQGASKHFTVDAVKESYYHVHNLHIPFVKNVGQVDRRVAYTADLWVGRLFVTRGGQLIYTLDGRGGTVNILRETVNPVGANHYSPIQIVPGPISGTKVNYFIGAKQLTNIPAYNEITMKNVADKIDLTLRAYKGKVEKIFEIHPGGDPSDIFVRVDGAEKLEVKDGKLFVSTKFGEYYFTPPMVYQMRNGKKVRLKGGYTVFKNGYTFVVESYDRSKPLYIDPVMYGTHLGGGSISCGEFNACGYKSVDDMVIDGDGNLVIVGSTGGGFPTTSGSYQIFYRGGSKDAYIIKISPELNQVVASTYLGGSALDYARRITIASDGTIFVAGWTSSKDFPATVGSFDTDTRGGYYYDGFIARFSNDLGRLEAATFLGGGGDDYITAMEIYPDGSIFVAGYTDSYGPPFPTTQGAYQDSLKGSRDIFISRLSSDLKKLLASTYFGGSDDDGWIGGGDSTLWKPSLKVDRESGNIIVAGSTYSWDLPVTDNAYDKNLSGDIDGFISVFSPDLGTLIASTYFGGNGDDIVTSIDVNEEGKILVALMTGSDDLPVSSGAYDSQHSGGDDGFIAIFPENLSSPLYTTYLGGSYIDVIKRIRFGKFDKVLIAGWTKSTDIPGITNGYQTTKDSEWDKGGFAGVMNYDLSSLEYFTYLDRDLDEEIDTFAVDRSGNIFAAGYTGSYDFPVSSDAIDNEFFTEASGSKLFVAEFPDNLLYLTKSTFFGGNEEINKINGIASSGDGSIYVVGETMSYNFPVTDQPYRNFSMGEYDVVVSKLDPSLSRLLSSTYIGGCGEDYGSAIALGDSGDVYIAGETYSDDYPTTQGAYSDTYGGNGDAFISVFNPNLDNLVASTFLGGEREDYAKDIITTSSGDICVTGYTYSLNFPTTYSMNFGGYSDGFVSRFRSDLGELKYSIYLPGGDYDYAEAITEDKSENIYVAGGTYSNDLTGNATPGFGGGEDAFVVKLDKTLDPDKAVTVFSGGSNNEKAYDVVVDNENNVYVAGWTKSDMAGIGNGAYQGSLSGGEDGFIAKYDSLLSNLLAFTYIGGTDDDEIHTITLDGEGHLYVAGETKSYNFPVSTGNYKTSYGGYRDVFIGKFDLNLKYLYSSTFIGGIGYDYVNGIQLTGNNVYIAGYTESYDFPTTSSSFDPFEKGCYAGYILALSKECFSLNANCGNNVPSITSVTANPDNGDPPLVSELRVAATDPDSEKLFYYFDCANDGVYEGVSIDGIYKCIYNAGGTYTVKVKVVDVRGGEATSTATVSVGQPANHSPEITSFKAEPTSGYAPLTVTFTVNATDQDNDTLTYRWDFDGDGNWDKTGNSQETHQYSNPGTYTVKVEVDDGNGGKADAAVEVRVLESGGEEGNEQKEVSKGGGETEKSSGCSCQVGEGSGNIGDLLFYILLIFAFAYYHKPFSIFNRGSE